jgi:hypothetical protein
LGGWAAYAFGYEMAFIINAVSFLASAWTVWLIPEEATRDDETAERMRDRRAGPSFMTELREGLKYSVANHFALTILIMNMIWATGGGAINIIFERSGGVEFAASEGWNPDIAVAILWSATGLGLTVGMLLAHRVSGILDRRGSHYGFIGWALVVHGVLFSIAGVMPTLLLFAVLVFISRAIVGVEYAVQETMFQRSLPDRIRGRISTLDRGAELTVFGIMSYVSGALMLYMTPTTLTIISGILSALAGIVWFVRERRIDPSKEVSQT